MTNRTNWGGNYTYGAARFHAPATLDELRALVERAAKVKVLGTRHSFNGIADTTGDLVSLERFDRILDLDASRCTVTIEGGVVYGKLCAFLHERGFALHNLASLPHISVAGACATATHGSGDAHGNLATVVSAMELVTADGSLVRRSRDTDGERFAGMPVHLGALGVITKLTLDVVPAFAMRQDVYDDLPLDGIEERFEAIASSAYSVSLFTDWSGTGFTQVWVKRRVADNDGYEAPKTLYEATLAAEHRHPVRRLSAESCTRQMGLHGAWHERLPHFVMEYTPSTGEELQSEYLVPRQHACSAFRALHALRERIPPVLQLSEVRTIAADDLWMSPCYRQACVGIHFTWKRDVAGVTALLPAIEEALAPFDARPHWGKLFATPRERLTSLFPRLADFAALAREHDPDGKLRNAFLDAHVLGA